MGKRVGGRKWMIRSQLKTWGLNKDGMGLCLDNVFCRIRCAASDYHFTTKKEIQKMNNLPSI